MSVIILSWNVRDLLRACLRSLPLADSRLEVIVVDAASADGSAEMVEREFVQRGCSAVRLMASTENLGYSRGNNVGMRLAQGRYLFIMNPDTQVAAGALWPMVSYMEAHPQVGALGPRVVYPGGAWQSTARRFPTLGVLFLESTWVQKLALRRWLDRYYACDLPADTVGEVDWVVGAALCIRREAYSQIGGFDEDFFMYSEELDWCRRLKAAGWKVVYFPAVQVTHYEARSSAQVPAATHIRFNSSKVRYTRKYHGMLAAEALRLWLLGNFACQVVVEGFKWLVGHKRPMRAARLAAYWQVLQSGLR